MRFCKIHQFNDGILGINSGWSLAGPPLMKVYCYIFDNIMIDTGLAHMEKEIVAIARENNVERIYLTHHHEDHSGNAAALGALGSEVYGHDLTRKKLEKGFPILPYQKYVWGRARPATVKGLPSEADTPSGKIKPIPAPGHSKDHTVFFLPEKGIVFSGDLYLADRIKFFRSDEDIGLQIDSLKAVANLDFDNLLCSHNPRPQNGKRHIRAKLEFLEEFYGNVIHLWKKGLSERQILKRLRLKESYLVKYFCFGNVSMLNGVRSAVRQYKEH